MKASSFPGRFSGMLIGAMLMTFMSGTGAGLYAQLPDIVYTSGAYIYTKKLISVPGQGLDLNFSVEFKSRRDSTFFADPLRHAFGPKWLHSYQWQMKIDKDTIRVFNPSGGKDRFVKFVGDPWVRSTLKDSNSTYVYTQKDRTRYVFSHSGNLLRIVDATGLNSLEFQWTALAASPNDTVLIKVADTRGNGLYFLYGNSSRVTSIEYRVSGSSSKLAVGFSYTDGGDLRKIMDVNGDSTTFISEGATHNILSVTNGSGHVLTQVTYLDDRIRMQKDGAGNASSYQYLPFHSVAQGRFSPDSFLEITKRSGAIQNIWYDKNQNIVKTSTPASGYVETYTFDARGNMIAKAVSLPEKSLGLPESMIYDTRDNLAKRITFRTVMYPNSALQRVSDTVSYAYDSLDHQVMAAGPNRDTTRWMYGSSISPNLMTGMIDPFGGQRKYEYNSRGLQTGTVDEKGNTSSNFRNVITGEAEFEVNALGEKTYYLYDEFGRRTAIIGPRGDTTRTEYDTKGRTVRVIDALGNRTSFTYDCDDKVLFDTLSDNAVNRYEYTSTGKLRKVINARGDSAITEYNAEELPVKTVNEKGLVHAFAYDSADRLIKITDPAGKTTTCTYDSANNMNSITNPAGNTSKYYYDEAKRIMQRVHPLGNKITIVRLSGITRIFRFSANGKDSIEGNEFMTFNKGRLETTMAGWVGKKWDVLAYFYDAAGNIDSTVITKPLAPEWDTAKGSVLPLPVIGRASATTYDRLNRPTSRVDRYGNTIRYSYDKGGNIDTLFYTDGKKVAYAYDLINRLTRVVDWNGNTTTYSYDKSSNVVRITLPDSSIVLRTYDEGSRPVGHIDTRGGDTLMAFNYTLDALGNRVSQTGKTPLMPVYKDSVTQYQSNELSQLVDIDGRTYAYDPAGNLIKGYLNNKSIKLTYTAGNQLQSMGTDTFAYDIEQREYRTFSRISGETTIYVNDVNNDRYQVLEEHDSDGTIKARNVYGIGLISRQQGESVSVYHFDPQGNTLALTDLFGKVTDTYAYDPYGKVVRSTGTTKNPYKFGGREGVRDDGNGLYFMRSRYYSPEMMRFIQMDRNKSGELSNPQTLNMYTYTAGNPVNYNDPDGDFLGIDDLIVFAVGFVAGTVAQLATDLITGEWSSWEEYLGAGMNTGTSMWATMYVGPALGGMLGGMAGSATTQGLSILAGDQESWSWADFGISAGTGLAFGFIGGKLPGSSAGTSIKELLKDPVKKFGWKMASQIAWQGLKVTAKTTAAKTGMFYTKVGVSYVDQKSRELMRYLKAETDKALIPLLLIAQ